MKRYINIRTHYGVETIDEIDGKDFKTRKEFRRALWDLKESYALAYRGQKNQPYVSRRCTNDWKNS